MSGNPNINNQLIASAKGGNREALAAIYSHFSKPMFGICMRMLAKKADAEDVLQEAFVLAFNNLRKLKSDEKIGGWLRTIVINECIRFSKARINWKAIEESPEATDEKDEDNWFVQIKMDDIYEEIKNLPDGYRQVFNLFALEDFSHKEIALKLGISESTSKSQYHKAKRLLKERLLKKVKQNG